MNKLQNKILKKKKENQNSFHCIGEFCKGTSIFDSILRINGTVYSTLRINKKQILQMSLQGSRRTFRTIQASPMHSYAFVFGVENLCTSTYDEHYTDHQFERKRRVLSHPVDIGHLCARDYPIRLMYLV